MEAWHCIYSQDSFRGLQCHTMSTAHCKLTKHLVKLAVNNLLLVLYVLSTSCLERMEQLARSDSDSLSKLMKAASVRQRNARCPTPAQDYNFLVHVPKTSFSLPARPQRAHSDCIHHNNLVANSGINWHQAEEGVW